MQKLLDETVLKGIFKNFGESELRNMKAINELNLVLEIKENGPLRIELFDLNSKRVYVSEKNNIDKGYQYITLTNINVPSGQYILNVQAGDFKASKSVLFE